MIFVVVLHVIVSFVLIFVILLQSGKGGGGLSEAFGGASQQLFGTKSSSFLNRATTVCAILFLMTCLSLGILSGQSRRSLMQTTFSEVPEVPLTEVVPTAIEETDDIRLDDIRLDDIEPDDIELDDIQALDETVPEEDADIFPSL